MIRSDAPVGRYGLAEGWLAKLRCISDFDVFPDQFGRFESASHARDEDCDVAWQISGLVACPVSFPLCRFALHF
jgi:hypothetical protein